MKLGQYSSCTGVRQEHRSKQMCFISKGQEILYQSQDLQELYQLIEIKHFCLAPCLGCEEIPQVSPVAPTKGNGKLLTIFSPYQIL